MCKCSVAYVPKLQDKPVQNPMHENRNRMQDKGQYKAVHLQLYFPRDLDEDEWRHHRSEQPSIE